MSKEDSGVVRRSTGLPIDAGVLGGSDGSATISRDRAVKTKTESLREPLAEATRGSVDGIGSRVIGSEPALVSLDDHCDRSGIDCVDSAEYEFHGAGLAVGLRSIAPMPSQPQALQRYRLVARLGSGGMADVYLAVARGPSDYKKLVVLKVLRADVAAQEQPGFLQMFLDEGRLAGRLNHPHIIHSYEPGVDAGQHFIAMEYLEGQALNVLQNRWWQERDAHTIALELFVIAQILDGLEYAHDLTDYDGTPLNIVHRDVSPQNVFVTYSGHSKLLDFGIAKTLESSQTQGGIVKGKVAYMAPEQVRTRAVDRRADLFSVGVMLWECVAGRRMHTDASVFDVLRRVGEGDLPKLRDVAPDVSPQLESIVTRALAFEPADRYPDAQSFREELLKLPELQGISARDVATKLDQLFAKERSQLNQLIHEAMTGAEALELPAPAPAADSAWTGTADALSSHHQLHTLPLVAPVVAPPSPATTAATAASAVPAPAVVRNWRKSTWLGGAAMLLVLVGVASLVSMLRGTPQTAVIGAEVSGNATQFVPADQRRSAEAAAPRTGTQSPLAGPFSATPSGANTTTVETSAASASPTDTNAVGTSADPTANKTSQDLAASKRETEVHPVNSTVSAVDATNKPAQASASTSDQKAKASTSSVKATRGTTTLGDGAGAATRRSNQKHDWVVPFPKLDHPKQPADSSARH